MDTANLKTRLNGKMQTRQSEPTEGRIVAMPNAALAPANASYVALTNNALDIIGENLKNQPLSLSLFDVVKSPSGGATVFSVPGLSGDEAEKELTGIVLDYTTPRAYWDTSDPVEGEPPVCFSRNSLTSHDGKPCSRCVYNDFGSNVKEDSNAKACKESVLLFLLRPDSILPLIVRVPVSSKLIFQRYMTRLIGRMIPLYSVVTRITLEKATSKAGKPYALYSFEAVGALTQEESANARAFGAKFMEVLNAAETEPLTAEVG
jgi:hypothetical protein